MDITTKLHHVCIVVHDIDKTQTYYESIGVGPWESYPPLVEYEQLDVPHPDGFFKMQYRTCNLPNVQIQLCQPSIDPTPQRKHLDEKGEGVFHLGFEVPDADQAEADAKGRGLSVLMRGRRENRTGFTYYNTADRAGVILLTRATNLPGKGAPATSSSRQPVEAGAPIVAPDSALGRDIDRPFIDRVEPHGVAEMAPLV